MKLNSITPAEMMIILEGLSMVVVKSRNESDKKKVQITQQLHDRLNDYTTDFINSQKQEEE
tara:strand:- start:410 stop:592 length:183 start_codon:yes stop_codon:yes gene_type:complete